jgi:hypothetical protein
MKKNGEIKHKIKILWVFLGIILVILIAGTLLVGLVPSLNESADNEIAIPEPPIDRPTQLVITPWYLLPNVDIGDGGLITKDPCAPPCFWNITPGITTLAEVYEIIEDKEITDACETLEDANEDFDYISCGYAFEIAFFEKSDIVANLSLGPTQEIKMKDIIHELGPPDRVVTMMGEIPDALEFLDMWIYYDDILTEIRLETQDYVAGKGYYHVSETTIVDGIYYYEEEGYKNDIFYRHASQWQGYGEYLGEPSPYP